MKFWILFLLTVCGIAAHAQTAIDTASAKPFQKKKIENRKDTVDRKTNDLSEVSITSRYHKKYNIKELSKTLRMNTPLLQLPQNIQEIDKEIIADQLIFNMTDGVTRNVSGVIRQEISNNLGPFMFMRGGLISTLRDGIDLTPIYRGPVPEDAAIIERVEFIKGPSMFMNSIGDPAGSFNVVTKQPTGKNNYSAEVVAGSYDSYRASADLDGLLDRKGKLQYRLNVMGMKSNSFVKYDFNDRLLVAPVLKYVFNENTSITGSYMYQKFSYGLMSPIVMTPNGFGTLARDFTISEPSLKPYRPTDQTASLVFHHGFNPNWAITAIGGFMQNDNAGAYMWVTGVNKANPQLLLRNPKYDLTRSLVYSEQVFVNGKVKTGSLSHQLLAGADFNQKRFLADSYIEYDKTGSGTLNYYPLDVNNPSYGAAVPNYTDPNDFEDGNTDQQINYASFYALDEISLMENKLRFTFGGRFTTAQTENEVSGARTQSSNHVFTPRIGVSYNLSADLAVYYLRDKTFTPQAGSIAPQADGTGERAVEAKTGSLNEIGIKKDWLRGRWNTTLSVYRVTRAGVLSVDPDQPGYYIQIGKSTAKGVDFDLKGRIVNGLNVVINYAYTDSEITSDLDPNLIGARTPLYVKHIQNTWLTYDLPFAFVKGFGISTGYQYQAGRSGRYSTATPYAIPDFFRLDAGLRWSNAKVRVNMIVNNLLDKKLIGTPWLRNGLYYWIPQAPANLRLSVGYSF
jgi:iron complex outermembrane receptor protein